MARAHCWAAQKQIDILKLYRAYASESEDEDDDNKMQKENLTKEDVFKLYPQIKSIFEAHPKWTLEYGIKISNAPFAAFKNGIWLYVKKEQNSPLLEVRSFYGIGGLRISEIIQEIENSISHESGST